MVRPRIRRRIRFSPKVTYYKPQGVPLRVLDEVVLGADEIEAVRLIEVENLNQIDAAEKMEVSQSTLQRVLNSARKKIGEALVKGLSIKIEKNQADQT